MIIIRLAERLPKQDQYLLYPSTDLINILTAPCQARQRHSGVFQPLPVQLRDQDLRLFSCFRNNLSQWVYDHGMTICLEGAFHPALSCRQHITGIFHCPGSQQRLPVIFHRVSLVKFAATQSTSAPLCTCMRYNSRGNGCHNRWKAPGMQSAVPPPRSRNREQSRRIHGMTDRFPVPHQRDGASGTAPGSGHPAQTAA